MRALLTFLLVAPLAFGEAQADPAVPPRCSTTVHLATTTDEPIPPGIELVLRAGEEVRRQTSAGAGSYAFPDLPCTDWSLELWDVGGPLARFDREPDRSTTWEVRMRPVYPIHIRVRDQNGRAVAGIAYCKTPSTAGTSLIRQARLDVSGDARFLLEPGDAELGLDLGRLQPVSYLLDGTEIPVSDIVPIEVPRGSVRFEATVRPGASFEFRIVDAAGDPIPGDSLHLVHADGSDETRFPPPSMDWTRLDVPSLPVRVAPVAHTDAYGFEPSTVEVANEGMRVEFVGRRDEDVLRGLVVEAESRTPVADATVWVQGSPECGFPAMVISADGDGRFRQACPDGCELGIRVAWPGGVSGDRLQTIPASSCRGEHVFRVRRGAVVAGRIVDEHGQPLARAPVLVGRRGARTDGSGRFQVEHVLPGEYPLRLHNRALEELEATDSQTRDLKSLTLVRDDFAVEGETDGVDGADAAVPVIFVDERDEIVEIELRAIRGGRVCVAVRTDDPGFDAIHALTVFEADGEEDEDGTTRRMPPARTQADRTRICSDPLRPGDRLVELTGTFLPVWLPQGSSRDEAVAIRIEAGRTYESGPVDVTFTGEIRVRMLGTPSDDDRGRTPVFEIAAAEDPAQWTALSPEDVDEIPGSDAVYLLRRVPEGTIRLRACDAATACARDSATYATRAPIEVRRDETVEAEVVEARVRALAEPGRRDSAIAVTPGSHDPR